jgi:hypothetical protein
MKYNSNSEPAEMSCFRLNLLSYLRDAHSNKANDLSFIVGRDDMAAESIQRSHKKRFRPHSGGRNRKRNPIQRAAFLSL